MFKKITVTGETVIQTLREVANERPDYVYEAPEELRKGMPRECYYVHPTADGGEEPGCIVGQVLSRLGVPLKELKRHEHSAADEVVPATLDIVGPDSIGALNALVAAQIAQDGAVISDTVRYGTRYSWGAALEYAEGKIAPQAVSA